MLYLLRKLILSLVLSLCVPLVSYAADAQAQLDSFIKQVTAASGKFTQEIHSQNKTNQQHGDFAFARPNKFYWHIDSPYEQLVVSNGVHIFQYDPDLDQVTKRQSNESITNSPAAVLFGSGSLYDTFKIKKLAAVDGVQWLRATPKQAEAGFVHVDIGFQNNLPLELILLDSFGQETQIKFTEFDPETPIPDDKFDFQVPAGVDLVEMD